MCRRFIREWPEERHPEGATEKGSRTGHWERFNCHTVVKRPQGVPGLGSRWWRELWNWDGPLEMGHIKEGGRAGGREGGQFVNILPFSGR